LKEQLNRESFISAVTKLAESVYDFHERWNLLNTTKSYFLSIQEREELLMEEIRELSFEYNKNDTDKSEILLCQEAADVLYVALGNMIGLNKVGLNAIHQVADKNNKKTSKTHFFDKKLNKVKKLNI
jgi:NTP pyrophosphatase (non-canonical NTP hydrolase)|tara:strand:+ start:18354 stop:18734 length:381 start_codon:yes stop_codon:yes gene_type:complete